LPDLKIKKQLKGTKEKGRLTLHSKQEEPLYGEKERISGKQFLKDTTWDSLKARWGKIDTVKGDSSYFRVNKARVGRIDTSYGDTSYNRVIKSRIGRIDTIYSDSAYSRVSKSSRLRVDTAIVDSIRARVMSVNTFDIDTITSDTIYSKVIKTKRGRIDTVYSDTGYSRVYKSRKGRIDTLISDTIYSRVGYFSTVLADSLYTNKFNLLSFDTGTFSCTLNTLLFNTKLGGSIHYTKIGNVVILKFLSTFETTVKNGNPNYVGVDLYGVPAKLNPSSSTASLIPCKWVGGISKKRNNYLIGQHFTISHLRFMTTYDGSAFSDTLCADSAFGINAGTSYTYTIE
jgi:hypothetical protein